jgi:hypothetical protein
LTEHWLVVKYQHRGKLFGNAFRKSIAGKLSDEAVQVFAKSAEMPITAGIPEERIMAIVHRQTLQSLRLLWKKKASRKDLMTSSIRTFL